MRNILILIFSAVVFAGCAGGKKNINKILKSTDPEYKLRMAEQFFAKKKYRPDDTKRGTKQENFSKNDMARV